MFTMEKLQSALQKLIQENFMVSDDTVLGKLYHHISTGPTVKDNISVLLPMIGDWFKVVVERFNRKEISHGVQLFSIRFIGYIASCSDGFKMLQERKILTFIQSLIYSADIQKDSFLLVSLINSLEMCLNHQEGWKWITETKIYEHVVNSFHEDRNIYINRTEVKFIAQLLIKSTDHDADVGRDIMNHLCKPLISNHVVVLEAIKRSNNDYKAPLNHNYIGKKITATPLLVKTAKYLCQVLEVLQSTNGRLPMRLSLVNRYKDGVITSILSADILSSCSSAEELLIFSSLLIMVDMSNLFSADLLSCNVGCCLWQVHSDMRCVISCMLVKHYLQSIVDFCTRCLSWLFKIKQKKISPQLNCVPCAQIESSMVCCMVSYLRLHNLCYIDSTLRNSSFERTYDMESTEFGEKVYKIVSAECFSFRGMIAKLSFVFIHQAIMGITRSLDYIQYEENIVNIFIDVQSALSRTVNNYNRPEAKSITMKLLSLQSDIIEKRRLPVFRTDLIMGNSEAFVPSVIKLLELKDEDLRVTIISLQTLIKVLKFQVMPDFISKSVTQMNIPRTLDESTPYFCNEQIFVDKLDCESWEVRDTVLELFQDMINLAELMPWLFINRFPYTLPIKVFEKAAVDESAYVRASALNFFSKAVRCKFFEEEIHPRTLLNSAFKTVFTDNMPIARIAACNLITALYVNYVPVELNDDDRIFESMFLVSQNDLDWEVKKAALNFWQCTINKHLMDQKLPFQQYIVPLQDLPKHELVPKIISVLETLGKIGCLQAIWLGLNDECDLKVSEEAHSIVESLEKINVEWNLIDELLKCHNDHEEKDPEKLRIRLNPKDFFSLLQKEDWKEKLEARKTWIEDSCDNLDSILDDILEYDERMVDVDHNAVDCY